MIANSSPWMLEPAQTAFFHERSYPHAQKAGPGLLMLMDGFVTASPDNPDLLLPAAEMNCSFAQGMAEPDDPAWASALYWKGRIYALRVLVGRDDALADALTGSQADFEAALEAYGSGDVPALFWGAMCWGSWINVNMDDMDAVAQLAKVKAMMQRVMDLDETFYHGGPHLFFGTMAGSLPEMVGGDPAACESHFQRVFEITHEKFLLAHVYYAKTCAVQKQDRALYVKTLRHVLDAPADIDPEIILFTAVAKKLAQDMLETVNERFLPVEGEEPSSPEDDELMDLLGD